MEGIFEAFAKYAARDPLAAALMLLMAGLIVYDRVQQRRARAEQREDEEKQALIALAQGFLQSMSSMADKFAQSLETQNKLLAGMAGTLGETNTAILGARREWQTWQGAQLGKLDAIQARIDKLPAAVEEQLSSSLGSIQTGIDQVRSDVQEATAAISRAADGVARVNQQIAAAEARIIAAAREAAQQVQAGDGRVPSEGEGQQNEGAQAQTEAEVTGG